MSLGSTINFRFELSGLCLKSREHLGTTPPLVRFYAESLRKAKQRRRSELGAYHCAAAEKIVSTRQQKSPGKRKQTKSIAKNIYALFALE